MLYAKTLKKKKKKYPNSDVFYSGRREHKFTCKRYLHLASGNYGYREEVTNCV